MVFLLLTAWIELLTGSIVGVVRSDPQGEALPYATIEVPALALRTVADERGYFALGGLPPGVHEVRVQAHGFAPWRSSVDVQQGRTVHLDPRLVPQPIALSSIDVTADPGLGRDIAGPSGTRLDAAAIRAVPALGESDVFRAVQTLPSIAASSDFSSALYVRGGSPDQTLISLDGVPLFNPYHVGGLFAAIDPDAVALVEVRPGALPAAAGDRLSGAVDIRTRDGARNRIHGSGGVSMLASRFSIDGPLPTGKGTFIASGRRSYIDLLTRAAEKIGAIERSFPYSFSDVHVKATHDVGPTGRLSAFVYTNRETFDLPSRWELGEASWRWGSRAAAIQYRRSMGSAWAFDGLVGVSRFDGRLESMELVDGTLRLFPVVQTGMEDIVASVQGTRYAARHRSRVGVQLDAYGLSHRVREMGPGRMSSFFPALDRVDSPRTVAVHASDEWTLNPDLRLQTGVRVLHAVGGWTTWMPRAGLRWHFLPTLDLTVGGGRYAQVLHSLRDEESVAASIFAYDLLVAEEPTSRPALAEDVVLGLEWSASSTLWIRADGYLKRLRNLPLPPLAPNPRDAAVLVANGILRGEGEVRGLEVLARHQSPGLGVSLAYALMRAQRTIEDASFTPRYERRHTVDISGSGRLGSSGEGSFRVVGATGQPYTPATGVHQAFRFDPWSSSLVDAGRTILYGAHNSERLRGYFRVDAAYRRPFQRRWFGRQGVLTPYAQVINAFAIKNSLSATPRDNAGRAELELDYQLPFLPTIGAEWRF